MNRHISLMIALLAIQVLLISGQVVFDRHATTPGSANFLDLAGHDIDGLVVMGPAAEKVELKKTNGSWQLEVQGGLPAAAEKVTGVLNQLHQASAAWPVGTTKDVARRFEVSAKHFQRHLQLLDKGKVVADLFLGTSPGFRKVHARLADASNTYAIKFSNYEASLKAADWLDKSLLKPAGEIKSIARTGQWSLNKAEAGWVLQDLKKDEAADSDKIKSLTTKLENLRVTTWASAAETAAAKTPLFTLVVTLSDGSTIDYAFFQPQKEEDYLVQSSRMKGLYKMALYNAEPLNQSRQDLLATAKK